MIIPIPGITALELLVSGLEAKKFRIPWIRSTYNIIHSYKHDGSPHDSYSSTYETGLLYFTLENKKSFNLVGVISEHHLIWYNKFELIFHTGKYIIFSYNYALFITCLTCGQLLPHQPFIS